MKHRVVTPIVHYGGCLCVSGFLRFGSKEPQLPPKAIMEMRVYRVHGRSNTPRVCPASTNLTPRQHAAQDDQHDVTARRRRANAPTYGLGQARAPRHAITPGAAVFRLRIAAQAGLRPMLALCGHGGRARCVGSPGHVPTRHASASKPTSSTEWQLGHVERVGRGCRGRG